MPTGIYKRTKEHKERISKGLKGKLPKNFKEFLAKAHATPKPIGEKNPNWKGDEVGYAGVHQWLYKEFGKAKECEICQTLVAKKYEWSNITGEYKRDRSDWQQLCVSCHRKYDFEQNGCIPWNKGKKIQTNTGRTHFKKGITTPTQYRFPKGMIPHNKYLTLRGCKECGEDFQPREADRQFCSRECYWQSMYKVRHER